MTELSRRLRELGWVTDLWVAGSLATGDYVPGVSDLDLVAVVDGNANGDGLDAGLSPERAERLIALHRELDAGQAAGADLGCVYVLTTHLTAVQVRHPTWTHGQLVQRVLSGVTRAELVRWGVPVFGREPSSALSAMSEDDIRRAARDEGCGYWAWAARRPWMWLDPEIADLGLTSMARARHAVRTGQLLSKTAAIDDVAAPDWLREQLRARRHGRPVTSPRLLTAWIAWRDARRTTTECRTLGA